MAFQNHDAYSLNSNTNDNVNSNNNHNNVFVIDEEEETLNGEFNDSDSRSASVSHSVVSSSVMSRSTYESSQGGQGSQSQSQPSYRGLAQYQTIVEDYGGLGTSNQDDDATNATNELDTFTTFTDADAGRSVASYAGTSYDQISRTMHSHDGSTSVSCSPQQQGRGHHHRHGHHDADTADWDASNAFRASDSESETSASSSVMDIMDENEMERERNAAIMKFKSKKLLCVSTSVSLILLAMIAVLTVTLVPRDFQHGPSENAVAGAGGYEGTPAPYKNPTGPSLSIACQLKLVAQQPVLNRDLMAPPLSLAGQMALDRMNAGDASVRSGVGVASPDTFLFELNRTAFHGSMESCAEDYRADETFGPEEQQETTTTTAVPIKQGSASAGSGLMTLAQLVNLKGSDVTMELQLHPGRPPMIFDLSLLPQEQPPEEDVDVDSLPGEDLSPFQDGSTSGSSPTRAGPRYGMYARSERIIDTRPPQQGVGVSTPTSQAAVEGEDEESHPVWNEAPEMGHDRLDAPDSTSAPPVIDVVGGVEEVNLIMDASGRVTGSAHMGGSIYQISTLEDGSQLVEAMALTELPADDSGEATLEPDDDDEEVPGANGSTRHLRTGDSRTLQQYTEVEVDSKAKSAKNGTEDGPLPVEAAPMKPVAPTITYIDVLVPYTRRVYCAVVKATSPTSCKVNHGWRPIQMKQRVDLMMFEANVALLQSGITDKQFRLAHSFLIGDDDTRNPDEIFDEQAEERTHSDLLKMAARSGDDMLNDITDNRELYKADVVAFLIDQQDQCGLAYGGYPVSQKWAYATINYKCATGYYSFAHELAHLLGARHDRRIERCSLEDLLDENVDLLTKANVYNNFQAYNVSTATVEAALASTITNVDSTSNEDSETDTNTTAADGGQRSLVPVFSRPGTGTAESTGFVGGNGGGGGGNRPRPGSLTASNMNNAEEETDADEDESVTATATSASTVSAQEKDEDESEVASNTDADQDEDENVAETGSAAVNAPDGDGDEDADAYYYYYDADEDADADTDTNVDADEDEDDDEKVSIDVQVIQKLTQSGGCCGGYTGKPCDGFGFQDLEGRYRTVMAYNCPNGRGGCPRIQMFSQPYHDYEITVTTYEQQLSSDQVVGMSAGQASLGYQPVTSLHQYKVGHDLYNNARQIEAAWLKVSNYRQAVEETVPVPPAPAANRLDLPSPDAVTGSSAELHVADARGNP